VSTKSVYSHAILCKFVREYCVDNATVECVIYIDILYMYYKVCGNLYGDEHSTFQNKPRRALGVLVSRLVSVLVSPWHRRGLSHLRLTNHNIPHQPCQPRRPPVIFLQGEGAMNKTNPHRSCHGPPLPSPPTTLIRSFPFDPFHVRLPLPLFRFLSPAILSRPSLLPTLHAPRIFASRIFALLACFRALTIPWYQ
jgi:hypothetical protein